MPAVHLFQFNGGKVKSTHLSKLRDDFIYQIVAHAFSLPPRSHVAMFDLNGA